VRCAHNGDKKPSSSNAHIALVIFMSDFCDVALGDYDCEPQRFYHEERRRARKAHTCGECRETIQKGQMYRHAAGKDEDTIWTFKSCEACWEILKEFSESSWCFGVVWDTFTSEWANGASLQGCLNRLTSVEAKMLMRRKWMQWKGLSA